MTKPKDTGKGRWGPFTFLLLSVLCLYTLGCSQPAGDASSYRGAVVLGEAGRQPGQFSKPRALAVADGELIVIDRTGRIQFYNAESLEFIRQWRLPAYDNGTPTGICADTIEPRSFWIADTHYARIARYSLEGDLLFEFGEAGEEPGKMIFPTDVAVSPDGQMLWITEYGRRNRIMQFTRNGEFIREWGTRLYENIDLERPMAIAVSPDAASLYVVDAGNHRINIYDLEGNLKRRFGEMGSGPGELKYPLDLAIAPDNTLYIVGYEHCRISQYTLDGDYIASWGEPGRKAGQMFFPWGCAVGPDQTLYIADTNNQRLQVVRNPDRYFHAGLSETSSQSTMVSMTPE